MFQQLRMLGLGLIIAGLSLVHPGAARAQTTPLKGSGVGQVIFQIDPTPDSPGVQVYRVDGVATLAGRVTGTGITFFTLGGAVEGSFVATSANGDTVDGDYAGTWAPVNPTTFRFDVETAWHDGTGRFVGITGESDAVAILDGLTGAFEWTHDGIWMIRD
jgi:hypothetical protein